MKKCESDQIYLEQRCIALNAHKYTILTSILKSQIVLNIYIIYIYIYLYIEWGS